MTLPGQPGVSRLFHSDVSTTAIVVDLDGVADDGVSREGDNVRSDVENIFTGIGADTVTGCENLR